MSPAVLVERENRFRIVAEVGRRRVALACRDPGRMTHLLVPGSALQVSLEDVPGRRTRGTVWLVRAGRIWVSAVPALANALLASALSAGRLPGLADARVAGAEITLGHSRFDFLLRHRGRRWLTEVKSVGAARAGVGEFPDAPTRRGARHLRELARRARSGGAALLAFVAQRGDVDAVRANAEVDPDFADALQEARAAGVRVRAWGCEVTPRGLRITRRLRVLG